MKHFLLTFIFLLFCSPVWAVDVDFTQGSEVDALNQDLTYADNGTCEDEFVEYDRLLGITSASDEDKASAVTKRDEAISIRMTGRQEDCETLMREAIDLIPE